MSISRHFYRCRFIYLAFLLSTAIFVIVCKARYIYPFGTQSLLKIDLFHQYAPYLEEFRSRVLGGKSLIYSWETGLGKDFLVQTAYYAASPLNVLVFLFPRHMISEVVMLLVLLKIGFSSSAFTWYLREHFRRNDPSILLFGLMYAFCAFVTCYYWNIMWLDTVMLFPLTVSGCEKLVREGKVTLYYAALTLTMIVNFYLAFLVCILITLYAIVYTLSFGEIDHESQETASFIAGITSDGTLRRHFLRIILRFTSVSMLSAMSAMFILLPVAAALRETAASTKFFPSLVLYPNCLQMLSAHFLGARDSVLARNGDIPNIYSGILPILLLPIYYRCSKIPRREKILYSSLLVFMLLCACFSQLDFMIHGFHFPANLPHRYTFVYSFVLLCMAYRGFDMTVLVHLPRASADTGSPHSRVSKNETVKTAPGDAPDCNSDSIPGDNPDSNPGSNPGGNPDSIPDSIPGSNPDSNPGASLTAAYVTAAVCSAAIVLYECFIPYLVWDIDHVLSWTDILLNIVVMVVYLTVLTTVFRAEKGKINNEQRKRLFNCLVFPVLFGCVIFECAYSLYQNMYDTAGREAYVAWLEDTDAALAHMENEEVKQGRDFFRTDFRRLNVINEGALYHFNGFSHFSSLVPGGISMLMEHMGIAAGGNSYRFYDSTPLLDAVCSVRYVMSKGMEFPISDLAYKYTSEKQTGSIWYAENRRILPLGFMTDPELLDWQTEDSQPFEVQNDFVHRATGLSEDIFTMVPLDTIQTENIVVENANDAGDVFSYKVEDPYDMTAPPSVHAELVSNRDQYLWLYVSAPNALRFVFEKKSAKEDRELSTGLSMINVGHVSKGEKIVMDFPLTRQGDFERLWRKEGSVSLFAASWNDEVFEKAYNILNRDTLQLRSFTDTRIEGTIKVSEDGILLTSIPYASGWSVFIDGKPVEKLGIGENGLLGAMVTAGTHEVLLKYSSPYVVFASVCSVTGVLLFIFLRRHL